VSTAANKPGWRKIFDAIEGRAAPPIEKGVRTDMFNDALALVFRTRRAVDRAIEERMNRLLHVANFSTATDVRRLSEQVAALHREVRALRRELDG
jgi:polyhydroxyalkanoate synthesis regulator phasin